jgi:hypothetical protein
MVRFILAAAVAALALAPASASADAVCTLHFDVRFDDTGRFSQAGAGSGACAGNVAGVALDPAAANPSIAGVAAPGTGCALGLDRGSLELRPRRAFEMWAPEHLELTGEWRAIGAALSGTLVTGSTAVAISGSVSCAEPGRLDVQLVLGSERPVPAKPAPAAEPPAPAPAAKKPKARKRRTCRRAKSARAVKRCRARIRGTRASRTR